MPNYEGQLYGKVKKRYLELQATTEDFDKLNDKIEDLTAQLQKAEQDKKAMGELLTEIQEDYQNEANEYYILSLDAPATFWQDKVNKIHNLLTQCGITHIIH
jgi:DNA repair exonuclease SbcCD ATPase subunit